MKYPMCNYVFGGPISRPFIVFCNSVKQRRLIWRILTKTKGLTALFLSKFSEQQLFNYYYRLILPPKHLDF